MNRIYIQTIIALALLCTACGAKAQSLQPSVIGTLGGHSAPSGGPQLSYNMGETFVATLTSGSSMLTQGFEQAFLPPAAVTGTTTLCAGSTTSLTSATTGGTWNSSNTVIATVGSATGVVNGVAAGTATISYTVAGESATTVVTVSGVPTITTVSPSIAIPATLVTITGTSFNTTTANNIVYFGATRATVNTASGTSLNVTVPVGATYMPVTVLNTACALTGYSQYPFLPTWDNSGYLAGVANFADKIDFTAGSNPCDAAIADIDGDGKAELVVVNQVSNTISVFRNNSTSGAINSGSFSAKVDFATGGTPAHIAIGDIDGDGKPDIAVTNRTSNTVSVFRNTSSIGTITAGSLATKVDFTTGSIPFGIAIGDLDGDGRPELAATNSASNNVSVFRNVGSSGNITTGTFSAKVDFATSNVPRHLAIGDIDGDGKPDLAVANSASNSISVLRNTSIAGTITSSSFSANVDFSTGNNPVSMSIGDLDADGKADIAVANNDANTVSILRNTSSTGTINSSTFLPKVDFATGIQAHSVAFADINGDSKSDMIVVNASANSVSAFQNISTSGSITAGSFSTRTDFTIGTNPYTAAIGDIDGDNKPDIVVTNYGSNNVSVLRNNPLSPTTGTLTLCAGNTTTLTNATTGGTWSSSNTAIATVGSSTGVVTGVAGGTATISYTVAGGSATTVVTVNPLPVVTISPSSSATICAGDTVTRTAVASVPALLSQNFNSGLGGWAISNVSGTTASYFQIVSSPGVDGTAGDGTPMMQAASNLATGTTSTRLVSPAFSTVGYGALTLTFNQYLVSTTPDAHAAVEYSTDGGTTWILMLQQVNMFSGTGTWSAATPQVNIALPVGALGQPNLKLRWRYEASSFYWLVDNIAVNATFASSDYSWAGPSGLSCTNCASPYFTSTSTGTYVYTVSVTAGCVGTATVSFTVIPLPASITGTLTVCSGATTTLSSATSGGTWSSSNIAVATVVAGSGVVTAVSAGTAVVTYTSSTGCKVSRVVTVSGIPAISSVSPSIAIPATSVTITGTNFNSTVSNNIVYFGATRATVGTASATSLNVTMPVGGTYMPVTVLNTACALTAYSQSPFLPTWDNSGYVSGVVNFDPKVDVGTGNTPSSVAIGDVDGDGKADLVVSNWDLSSNTVSVYRNMSVSGTLNASSFPSRVDFNTGAHPLIIVLADIDGDGKLDVVSSNQSENLLSILRNTSTSGTINSSSFASVVNFSADGSCYHLSAGDIDCDGKTDLVVANGTVGFNSICVFRNTAVPGSISSSSLAAPIYFATNGTARSVAISDIDRDGKHDITVTSGTNTVSVFRNIATAGVINSSSFSTRIDFAMPGNVGAVAVADMDGDAKNDLVVTNDSFVGIMRNIGTVGSVSSSTFAAAVNFEIESAASALAIGDMNGDGKPDIATSNYTGNKASVFINTATAGTISSGSLATQVVFATGINPYYMAIGDLDGDGKPDMVTPNGTSHNMSILRNNPLSPTTGTPTVCVGSSTTLTNTTTGGTWSSSNTAVATVGSATGVVTGVASGTVIISYTVAGGSFMAVVTVNPLADAGTITGPSSVNTGSTINLTISTAAGDWSSSNTAIATVGTVGGGGGLIGYVTGVSPGTAIISYTVSNSCGSVSATHTVTVTPSCIPTTGLVAWYPFNGNANDESGNGNNLVNNSCTFITDRNGNSDKAGDLFGANKWFGGSTSSPTVQPILSTGNNSSVSIWVKISTPSFGEIYHEGGGGIPRGFGLYVLGTDSGSRGSSLLVLDNGVNGDVTSIWSSGGVHLNYHEWHNVILVKTSNIVALYFDGNYNSSGTLSFSTLGSGWLNFGVPDTGEGHFEGQLDDIAIYNRALSSIEVAQIYSAGFPTPGTIIGPSSVNTSSTITLTNATTGGTWSSSNTSIATVGSTGVVAGVSPGTAIISYTVSNSCGSASATKVVTVNASLETPITGTFTVCAGATSTLSNATPGGTWSSGNTAVATVVAGTGVVTGVSAGTAVISYTLFGTSVTTVITVSAATSIAAITGTSSFCVGATSALSSATTGGTWSSSNTTIATVGSTGIVTGISGGTAAISYMAAGTCGTGYAVMIVEVLSLPAPISGTASVCAGASTELSSSPDGGTWASSNEAVATVSNGFVSGISAGNATITYTAGTGCYSTRQVTVLTTPAVITGTLTTCTGSTTTLSSATSGGTWTSGHLLNATVASGTGVVTGVATGTAAISYSLGNGCRRKVTVTVEATPAAITGSLSLCAVNSSALSSATTGGTWSSGATGIATVNTSTGVVTGVSAGTAIITYSTGSCSRTATVTVNAAAGANTGNALLCVGQASALSNSTSGGTWSSSDATVASVAASTGVVTGVAAGTAAISYSVSSGCYSITEVTVNAAVAEITGTLNVCPGLTTTLSNATGGGTWSSSNTTKATIDAGTGVATGIAAGSAIITYQVSAACYQTATLTIHTAPGNIGGTAAMCAGAATTLSCSPGGGTWSSSNTGVATIGSTGIVTSVSAGTTIISYTNSNGCAATKTATVYAMPTAITGTLLVCIGSTSALASTPAGGTWTSLFTSRANINPTTGVVTGVSTGTTLVSYTLSGGCRTTAIVTVAATPASITGTLTVCVGSNTALNSATTGGTWSSSDAGIATVAAGIVTGMSPGTATITYANSTCYRTATVTVNAGISANTGTPEVCVGQGTDLNNATSGGTWSSSNTGIATVVPATGLVAGINAGTVNISYRISASCYSITIVTVNAAPANITGTLSVCPGTTTTLGHPVSGGVWTSSNTAIGTIDAGTGIATGITSGTTIITYTLSTGCFRVATLTVNTAPGAITGTAAMCAGATTTLGCSPGGGTWSSTVPSVATISGSGVVTGIAAGNSTISYTNSGGCAAIRQVTVSATPGSIGGTLTACTGSTTTLSAAPGGGTWSSSNAAIASIGSASGIVTGEGTGTASITYSLSATCFVTAIATINTTPAPITGILTVCTACNTTLSSLTSGGVWSSAATGIATIGAGTGIVFGVSTGTTTISYVLGGCSRTAVMSVNPAISPSFGTPVVCVGQTNSTMSNPTPGGTWSSSNIGIVTVHAANGLLTGVSAGNANITYTTSPGMYTITVATVSPALATITGTANICPGNTVTLSNATTGGTWYSSDNTKATVGAVSGVVTGVTTGTATITYEVNVGCYRVTMQIINPVPTNIGGPATVVNGSNINLSSSPGGGIWTSDNAGIASVVAGTGVVTGVSIGATTITYTLGTGCRTTRGISVVASRPSSGGAESINQQAGQIKVYPNPTSGTLTVESGISGVFTVFTIDGKEVERYAVSTQATTVSLPQHLAAGVYMCRFTGTDGTTAIVRLVYER